MEEKPIKSVEEVLKEIGNNKTKTSDLVPFGKYKGQSWETLAEDIDYVNFMSSAHDWFRNQYLSKIQTLNFQEPSETPEHNKLQVLFLEDKFCLKFLKTLNSLAIPQARENLKKQYKNIEEKLNLEVSNIIKEKEKDSKYSNNSIISLKEKLSNLDKNKQFQTLTIKRSEYPSKKSKDEALKRNNLHFEEENKRIRNSILREESNLNSYAQNSIKNIEKIAIKIENLEKERILELIINRSFEKRGADVTLSISFYDKEYDLEQPIINEINIEIKPQVGDDYPAVLRQMRNNNSRILFLNSYTGIGADLSQFIKTFELSDIRVIFKHEVDEMKLK